jgi:hypothetical protein
MSLTERKIVKTGSFAGKAAAAIAAAGLGALAGPALAHHSFAMYDQTKTETYTGVTTQFIGQANHAELHFYVIGSDGKLMKDKDGKNVDYGVEMMGAAAMAQQGITASSFPAGTIFSVKVNPMRDGSKFGSRAGGTPVVKCPWKTPPAPGQTCATVKGSQMLGGTAF